MARVGPVVLAGAVPTTGILCIATIMICGDAVMGIFLKAMDAMGFTVTADPHKLATARRLNTARAVSTSTVGHAMPQWNPCTHLDARSVQMATLQQRTERCVYRNNCKSDNTCNGDDNHHDSVGL